MTRQRTVVSPRCNVSIGGTKGYSAMAALSGVSRRASRRPFTILSDGLGNDDDE